VELARDGVVTGGPKHDAGQWGGVAFLLAQLGAYAAGRFAARIAAVDLTPPQAGLLRAITRNVGRTQQQFAELLGVPPSRFVALVDGLEERGILERRRSPADRRAYELALTNAGRHLMRDLGQIGRAHEENICRGLTTDQKEALQAALQRIAAVHGLTPGVHPGFRAI
jgi:DNA-binding MarR family transcriptional regulator